MSMCLHKAGNKVLNDLNQVRRLIGINKGLNWLDSPGCWWMGVAGWDAGRAGQELDKMKSWGCNILRIVEANTNWSENIVDENGVHHQDMVAQLVQLMAQKGMYLMISSYCDVWNSHSGGGQGQTRGPYPPYNNRPDLIPSIQAWIDIYADMANKLKGFDNVLIEAHNEPECGSASEWLGNVQLWVNAIRATGFTGILVYQWQMAVFSNLDYGGNGATLGWFFDYPINDPLNNCIPSTHQYRDNGHCGQRQSAPGGNAYTYDDIKLAFQYERLYDVAAVSPLMIGECGCDVQSPVLSTELEGWRNQLKLYREMGDGVFYLAWWWRQIWKYPLITSDSNPVPTQGGQIFIDNDPGGGGPITVPLTILSNVEVPVTLDGIGVGATPVIAYITSGEQHTVSVPPEVTT